MSGECACGHGGSEHRYVLRDEASAVAFPRTVVASRLESTVSSRDEAGIVGPFDIFPGEFAALYAATCDAGRGVLAMPGPRRSEGSA